MQVWRWHVTMAASILFRATIIAATVGVLFVVGWLAALAFGPERYDGFLRLAGSPLGLFVGFGLTVKSANMLSSIAVWAPVPLAVLFWIVLFAAGRVSL